MSTRREGRKCGCLRLVVSGKPLLGNQEHILTNDLEAELTTVVLPKVSRWQVETRFFRKANGMHDWRRANAGWIRRWFATSASFSSVADDAPFSRVFSKLARTLCCGEAEPLPENELILRLPQAELMAHQHLALDR